MKFTAEISLDNAEAQDEPNGDYCLPDYLTQVAGKIRDGYSAGDVMDGNGNHIGTFEITGYR